MKKVERINTIMRYINNRAQFTISEIMHEFNISRSTAIRDIRDIEAMGMPLLAEVGRNGGYVVMHNSILPDVRFTDSEVKALFIAFMATRNQQLPYLKSRQSLAEKLLGLISENQQDDLVVLNQILLFEGTNPYNPDLLDLSDLPHPMLETLIQALLVDRYLLIQVDEQSMLHEVVDRPGAASVENPSGGVAGAGGGASGTGSGAAGTGSGAGSTAEGRDGLGAAAVGVTLAAGTGGAGTGMSGMSEASEASEASEIPIAKGVYPIYLLHLYRERSLWFIEGFDIREEKKRIVSVDRLMEVQPYPNKERLSKTKILERMTGQNQVSNLVVELGPSGIAQFKKYHPLKVSMSFTNPYQTTAVLETYIDVSQPGEMTEMINWLLFLGADIYFREVPVELLTRLQRRTSMHRQIIRYE